MDQTEIGKFIAKCRKEKNLTQAQLAERLSITDRAVSKWETGKSMPDASIMLELCGILGITVNELLSGKRIDTESYEKEADENLIVLKRKAENNMAKNIILSALFSLMLLIGLMVCLICDLATSGKLTWSPIPVSSIVFAWLIVFPGILLGKRGLAVSFLSLSVFLFPYLFLLSKLLNVKEVFSVGAAVAAASVVFLWGIVAVFYRMGKARKLKAFGITFLLVIPFAVIVNAVLSNMLGESVFDVWDLLTVFILLILAAVSFLFDYAKKKGLMK